MAKDKVKDVDKIGTLEESKNDNNGGKTETR